MSTAIKVGNMADPNDFGTLAASILGAAGLVGMGVMKIYREFFANRADAANSRAVVNMLDEIQEENKSLRIENNRLRNENATIMLEKFSFQSDLKIALDKIETMTKQMTEMQHNIESMNARMKAMSHDRHQ